MRRLLIATKKPSLTANSRTTHRIACRVCCGSVASMQNELSELPVALTAPLCTNGRNVSCTTDEYRSCGRTLVPSDTEPPSTPTPPISFKKLSGLKKPSACSSEQLRPSVRMHMPAACIARGALAVKSAMRATGLRASEGHRRAKYACMCEHITAHETTLTHMVVARHDPQGPV